MEKLDWVADQLRMLGIDVRNHGLLFTWHTGDRFYQVQLQPKALTYSREDLLVLLQGEFQNAYDNDPTRSIPQPSA